MNEWSVVVGLGSLGLPLLREIRSKTSRKILVVSNDDLPDEFCSDDFINLLKLNLNGVVDWSDLLINCDSIHSIYYLLASTKPRDDRSNELGFTDNFSVNISKINHEFLKLVFEARKLLTNRSYIVAISSVLGSQVALQDAVLDYHVSKSVLNSIVRHLSIILGKTTSVNCISPGLLSKGGSSPLINDKELIEMVKRSNPMERAVTPREVASMCHLITNGAFDYLNGQNLILDGGASIIEPFSLSKKASGKF